MSTSIQRRKYSPSFDIYFSRSGFGGSHSPGTISVSTLISRQEARIWSDAAPSWMARAEREMYVGNSNVVLLLVYGLGMSIGQVLFKLAADRARATAADGFLMSLLTTGYFYLAVAIYGVLT